MKKTVFLLCTATFLILGGCVFTARQQHETQTYDLQLPLTPRNQKIFTITAFVNDTPSRSRMLYRQNNNIVQDPYNCWIQSPERLLQRHYALAFPLQGNVKAADTAELRCTITAFEFDLQKSEARLTFSYALHFKGQRYIGTISAVEKLAGFSAAECASGMSKAAANAAEQLWQSLEKFTSQK